MKREYPSTFRTRHGMQLLIFMIFLLLFLFNMALTAHGASQAPGSQSGGNETFAVKRFVITGNAVFPRETLRDLLVDLRGDGQTAADIEKARDRIERYHHENGYLTTFVSIPEQAVEGGFIYLQVVEGKVGTVKVAGNNWHGEERILTSLPSLKPGEIVHIPSIRKELAKFAANQDLQVIPAFSPGKETGKTDVELKVEDKLPLHGSLELNNRNSLNTSDLRLNAMLKYDDLWNLRHSLSFQYQTAPREPSEVKVFSGSYLLPAPWKEKDSLVFYGVVSDSETGFGEGFKTVGKGNIAGVRYVMQFPPLNTYNHNLTLGFDYKDFKEGVGTASSITYLPFSIVYGSFLPDGSGLTQFNAGLAAAIRNLVTKREEFDAKRFNARGNYMVFTAGVDRTQRLPGGMELKLKVDGQIADQPLISNEQYTAGGTDSVRGYYESEASGDNAVRLSAELAAPELAVPSGLGGKIQFTPYLFYDYAALKVKEPQTGQTAGFFPQGTGIGARGTAFGFLEYQVDGAFALHDSGNAGGTRKGDSRVMFKVKAQF